MNLVKLERISDMLRSQVDSGAAAGCGAYVLKHGRPIYRGCAGMADIARNIKWADDTIVRLYSLTKPITAAAAMILLDRGQLDLYDKVCWYIPGFKNQTVLENGERVPVKEEVCIKDLLDMTSGLCYPDRSYPAGSVMQALYDKIDAEVKGGKPTDTMTYANLIGQQPLAFQPGDRWMYGTSADVLGAVIEAVCPKGMKFGDFLKEELFEPLGMVDTDFYVPEEKLCRFAENYEEKDGKLVPCLWQHLGLTYLCRKPPEFQSGGAGLCSTMDDYAAFAEMLLNGGMYNGRRILSENAVRYMTSNQLSAHQLRSFNWAQDIGCGYGNLMHVAFDNCSAGISAHAGEYGWDGWLGCFWANDPKDGYTFIYFVQRCGGLGPRPLRMIKQIVYGAED